MSSAIPVNHASDHKQELQSYSRENAEERDVDGEGQ